MVSSKPSQYTKGWVEFYKLKFKVTPDVLIPRPETELLVDEVLNFVNRNSSFVHKKRKTKNEVTILDLGTGSGNIAISLACNLKGCNVDIIATDISQKALEVAKQNAKLHGVEDKIIFLETNLLSLSKQNHMRSHIKLSQPDIIVTNLPYIPSYRIPYLDSSVKDFEPHLALDGGSDGFDLYRKLFAQISLLKCKPKLIVGEIDYTHGQLTVDEATKYFPHGQIEVKTDLAHKQRILIVKLDSVLPYSKPSKRRS